MSKTNLDVAQDITGKITSTFCVLSSVAIIAMAASTDPNVRKGSMGVIVVWFVLCLVNMIISSINAGEKGISLIESIKNVASSSSSSSSSYAEVGSSSG